MFSFQSGIGESQESQESKNHKNQRVSDFSEILILQFSDSPILRFFFLSQHQSHIQSDGAPALFVDDQRVDVQFHNLREVSDQLAHPA